ncbi:hypothetical protein DXG01_007809 [Tephrocybe rancida]|nr:hypothetical protein DXG01_007809 [Tephrocybe rancida]
MQMFGEIPDFLIAWIEKQQTFWVASAPLTADGLVNISPKGVEGTFHVSNSRQVWYEDLSGSGFVHEYGTPEYDALLPEGTRHPGSRAAIALNVFKVATTCGYSVPFYEFKAHRTQLLEWAAKKEAADRSAELTVGYSSATSPRVQTGLKRWWEERNTTSLDGLQGIVSAHVSDELFRSRPIARKSSYETTTIQSKVSRAFDYRIIIAFLAGILATCVYHRLSLTAHIILIN